MNSENTKPLWKLLNEQRTQGNLEVDIIEKEGEIHLLPNNKTEVFCSFYCLPFDEKIKPNAQYTALAVNNLHHLAEALEVAIKIEEEKQLASVRAASIHNNTDGVGIHFDYMSADPLPEWVVKAKEALNRIS